MVMNKSLLKEYVSIVVRNYLKEIEAVSTVSTVSTRGATTTSSTTGGRQTTATSSTARTGTGSRSERESEADSALENIEQKVSDNAEKISNVEKGINTMKGDATRMSIRTRDVQKANADIQTNVNQAATSTERLRDADTDSDRNAAYTDTSRALKGVATAAGTAAAAQGNIADILTKQGSNPIGSGNGAT
jgi:hypothetical protein